MCFYLFLDKLSPEQHIKKVDFFPSRWAVLDQKNQHTGSDLTPQVKGLTLHI